MAPHIINLEQNSIDWKNWRRPRIGASEIATIMGLNPWQSPLMLYYQKISGDDIPENEAMREGKRKEPLARACAERHFGCKYPPICISYIKNDHFISSLDGYNPNQKRRVLEIKCPGEKHHHTAKLGVICPHWYPQTQWQLFCDESEEMEFMSYMSDDDYEIITVKRDDKFISKAEIAANEFLACLRDFIEPEPMDIDLIEIVDPDAKERANILAQLQVKGKQIEQEIEMLKDYLKEKAGYRSARIGDYRFVKYQRKGVIDTKKIATEYNLNLDDFRKPSFDQWRFS